MTSFKGQLAQLAISDVKYPSKSMYCKDCDDGLRKQSNNVEWDFIAMFN